MLICRIYENQQRLFIKYRLSTAFFLLFIVSRSSKNYVQFFLAESFRSQQYAQFGYLSFKDTHRLFIKVYSVLIIVSSGLSSSILHTIKIFSQYFASALLNSGLTLYFILNELAKTGFAQIYYSIHLQIDCLYLGCYF